jgi:DNA-binding transcriptional LysR family regulator
MSLDQFIALITVAKHRNITRAAQELHITQPAISKQLRLLQDDYRVTLYYKKKAGGIEFTDEGRLFLAHAHRIVREHEALKMRFNRPPPRVGRKPFAVGGTYALAAELLPRLLSKFNKTHPLVNTALRTGSSVIIHDEVLRGDIEVGLVARGHRSKRLEVQPYSTHPLVAFVNKTHPYARKGELTPEELARAPLVVRGPHRLQSSPEIALRQCGYKPNVVARCETPEAVRTEVRNNLGVGVLFKWDGDGVKSAVSFLHSASKRTPRPAQGSLRN